MALFKLTNKQASKINLKKFKNEKELQNLFENNLEEIFGVRFLATEFSTTHGGRIDTLGIDDTNSPVIIEYKRTQDQNIINQGISYLKWLLDHKADFEMLCRSKNIYLDWLIDHKGDFNLLVQNKFEKDIDINWEEPRLIIVAQSYNEYDKYAVNRISDKIELWRYVLYNDNVLLVERIGLPKEGKKKSEKKEKSVVYKEYTLEDHIGDKSDPIKALVNRLREEILKLDDQITEKIKKKYIAYSLERNFAEIVVQNKRLWVHIDLPVTGFPLNDSEKRLVNISGVGHWATGDLKMEIHSFIDIDYCMNIVKQSYEDKL